jgi:hypothetical protein
MASFRTIETEGDGLKSYVATCVALLLGRRPVCLIDEPEMCLHPPQAYNLGRFIGRYGASPETATFVATHSSHILRGIIRTAPEVQIVRLIRKSGLFSAHLVPARTLAEAVSRPTVRAESVLDGIFAQAVAVVEADGDRAVYQAVWETLRDEFHLDVHFAAVGGTGGIADTCGLYRALRIPIAVLADLDLLADVNRLRRIVLALGTEPAGAAHILEVAEGLLAQIRKLPPTIEEADVHRRLTELTARKMDWDKEHDFELRTSLSALVHDLDRMRRLKRGGLSAFPVEISGPLASLLESLKMIGLFLVPHGELEHWLTNRGIEVSKGSKWEWANAAAQKVQELGSQQDDIWGFMRQVGSYLATE